MRGLAIRGRYLAAPAAAGALAVMALASLGNAASAQRGGGACANSTALATEVSTGDLRKAILCLVNKERTSRGHKALDKDRRLTKTAKRHNNRMIQTNCLDHLCGNEPDLETRIRNSGYFSGASDWDYAEDVGCERTAAQMVKNWMGSSLHRRNILNRKFDDAGVAASHGRVPSRCDEGFVTFTIVFGHRKG